MSPPERCALTAPFHPYLPVSGEAVCFLWHFPSRHRDWELPSALPWGVRTFLRPKAGDHLVDSNRQNHYTVASKTGSLLNVAQGTQLTKLFGREGNTFRRLELLPERLMRLPLRLQSLPILCHQIRVAIVHVVQRVRVGR